MRCTIEDVPRALCGEAIRAGARRSQAAIGPTHGPHLPAIAGLHVRVTHGTAALATPPHATASWGYALDSVRATSLYISFPFRFSRKTVSC